MMQFLIAAPRSGSGKTTVTCAVLTALQRRGADPCAFKCGPDYIDPMFHRSTLGVESHNLDLYLSAPDTVRTLYARYAAGHGAAVCEGAMGFYDGQGLTTRASAWELADTLALPVLLVVQPNHQQGKYRCTQQPQPPQQPFFFVLCQSGTSLVCNGFPPRGKLSAA